MEISPDFSKMDKKKIVFTIFSFIILLSGFLAFFYSVTKGFSFSKIECFTQEAISCTSLEIPQGLLKQKYRYLGKGAQVYAFLSEDEKHVLKIYRQSKYTPSFFNRFVSLFSSSYKTDQQKKEYDKKRSLESYPIAMDLLKPITALEYVHLNKTDNLPHKVVIQDRLMRSFSINLNNYIFLLQKKIDPLKSSLLKLDLKNDKEIMRKWIISYGKATLFRIEKKVADRDFINALRNAGIYNNEVVFMDVGGFYLNPFLQNKEKKYEELIITLKNLEDFINQNIPEMKSVFNEEKKHLLQEI